MNAYQIAFLSAIATALHFPFFASKNFIDDHREVLLFVMAVALVVDTALMVFIGILFFILLGTL